MARNFGVGRNFLKFIGRPVPTQASGQQAGKLIVSLYEEANIIVGKLEHKLDPLLVEFGFNYKRREPHPDIFAEILRYQKDNLVIKISICLHPHDYPNKAKVTFSILDHDHSKHADLSSLLPKRGNQAEPKLLLVPEQEIEKTITDIFESIKVILSNKKLL